MAQRSQLAYARKNELLPTSYLRSLKVYLLVTKPATVALLVFTAVVGFALASQGTFPPLAFLLLLLALILSCAGANTLTCYIDRDIDAIMERTKNRPIPSHQLSAGKALIFGLVLVALALGFAFQLNLLTFFIILAGIVNNVVMYSLWAKRRTSLNILVGSFAGGLPALAGYTAYANNIDLGGVLLGVIVMVWIPVHVWSIALKHKEDYVNAGVPMLPAVVGKGRAAQLVALASFLLVAISVVPAWFGFFGFFYSLGATFLGVILFSLSLWLLLNPSGTRAWVVFKASSLYLGLLFLFVLVDCLF